MIQFEKKCLVTGAESRVKKDGTSYILVHVMTDNGTTVSCMFKGDPNQVMGLVKMQEYNIDFYISVGQYTHLAINDIKPL